MPVSLIAALINALRHALGLEEDGQSMIEYALLAGLISIAAVAVLTLVGPYLQDWFQQVVNAFSLT